jgi:uncharacterized membrane protein
LIAITFFACLWCFGFLSPILYENYRSLLVSKPFTHQIYSSVCHQFPEKTFSINGEQLHVCSRCAGIYLGVLASLIISLIKIRGKNSFGLLLIASMIMLFDVVSTSFGLYMYSKPIAMFTGLFFGYAIINFVLSELFQPYKMLSYEK